MSKFKTLLAALLTGACLAAQATTLTLTPSTTTVNAGDSFQVDLVVSDLGSGTDLGAFDVQLNFDASLLKLVSYSLGSSLGDLSLLEALDLSSGLLSAGSFNLAEVSLLAELLGQADSFTLATLSFSALDAGSSTLSLSNVTLGDAYGDALSSSLESATVTANAVPEPASLALLATGLGLLLLTRRRQTLG